MRLASSLGGIGRTLAVPHFRLFWVGSTLSIFGIWIQKMALAWITWELTHSPGWLGVIAFAAMSPGFFLSPLAGTVADRFGLSRTAGIALLVYGASALALGLLGFGGLLTIEVIFALSLVQGTTIAFDIPARMALVPYLVARSDLSAAIALNTTAFFAGAFVGPYLFGQIFLPIGLFWAFIVPAVAALYFAGVMFYINRFRPKTGRERTTTVLEDMVIGVKYVIGHPGIGAIFLMIVVPHMFLRHYVEFLPAFSSDVFQRGAEGFAWLAGASGCGSMIGGIALAIRGRTSGLARLLVHSSAASAVLVVAFALTPNFAAALAILFALGFTLTGAAVASQSLAQNAADPAIRGRVIALSGSIAMGLPAFAALILGQLGILWGIQWPIAGAAMLGLIWWAAVRGRVLRAGADLEAD
jgi:MFS family permease